MKRSDGFALPASLLVLIGLVLLFTAGYQSARMDLMSARSLAASVQAFQAAEAGLELLETGSGSGIDSTHLGSTVIHLSSDTLRIAADGSLLMRHRAEAETVDGTGNRIGRRSVSRLWFQRPDGSGGPVAGGWRESMRPGSP